MHRLVAALVLFSICLTRARSAPEALDPHRLASFWDAHHVSPAVPASMTHSDVRSRIQTVTSSAPDLFQSEVIGESVEGRSLHHVWFGRGATRVLLWSQMHGDEPTATAALFDLFEWVRTERASPAVVRVLDSLTVHALPMVNPDGAERFRRRNAQGIDINRDALRLQTPEGRALQALRDRLNPVLGFNLHNQSWQTSVGRPPRPASISLLAVAHDEEGTDSPPRVLAKKTSAVVRNALEPFIAGQIGRYDDSFEVRAFGDNIALAGTGVVLIETGPYGGDGADATLVRLNFVALAAALDALATGRVQDAEASRYESLPTNETRLFHTLVRNATIVSVPGVSAFTADIGIVRSRTVQDQGGPRAFVPVIRVEDVGDLRVYGALETIEASGMVAVPYGSARRAGTGRRPSPRTADDAAARRGTRTTEPLSAGALVDLPDWTEWKGARVAVGAPGELLLLRPHEPGSTRYRIERVVR
jgi:Zinc carboxypeptidase